MFAADCFASGSQVVPGSPLRVIGYTWQQDLRYGYRQAHRARRSRDAVELDVVTQISEREFYVTGTVTVRWP